MFAFCCRLVCPGKGLVGDRFDGNDIAIDFFSDGTLFFRGAGNLKIHIADTGNGIGYAFHERFTARLNINNLFDTRPPQMADTVLQINTDSETYDVFGRSYFLSFTAELGE